MYLILKKTYYYSEYNFVQEYAIMVYHLKKKHILKHKKKQLLIMDYMLIVKTVVVPLFILIYLLCCALCAVQKINYLSL